MSISIRDISDYPKHKRIAALIKLSKLKRFNHLVKKEWYNPTEWYDYKADICKKMAKICSVSLRTMERWQSKYRQYGLRGLIDARGSKCGKNST